MSAAHSSQSTVFMSRRKCHWQALLVVLIVSLPSLALIESGADFGNYSEYFDELRSNEWKWDLISSMRFEPVFGILTIALTTIFSSNLLIFWTQLIASALMKVLAILKMSHNGFSAALIVIFYMARFFPLH